MGAIKSSMFPRQRIMFNIKKRNAELIRMMEEHPVMIDDHTGLEEPLIGLVEFNNIYKDLGCCFDARYFSVNACEKDPDDGKLHCLQTSVGGVLWGIDTYSIDKYNENTIQDGGKIKCIHLPNGTKVYPTK